MSFRLSPSAKLGWTLVAGFALLSVADFYLTWALISSDDRVVESNPIAAWWLDSYGWGGMAGFKLAMFALIGGLAAVVAARRPRLCELVLVFACGAQAAVVLTSLLHVRMDKEPAPSHRGIYTERPPIMPTDTIEFLSQPSVQEELKLSPAQVKLVAQWATQRRNILKALRQGSDLEAWLENLDACLAGAREWAQAELSPAQAQRLRQIDLQHRGVLALADSDVNQMLTFTEDQQPRVDELSDKAKRLRTTQRSGRWSEEARPQLERIQQEFEALLNPTQLAQWRDLTGNPFSVEPPTKLVRASRSAIASSRP
jgi:hypothetical protein